MRGNVHRSVLIATVSLLIAVSTSSPANAQTFHAYSVAYESSAGTGYSGVHVFRQDIDLSAANPCIYQTQWVMNSNATDWVELGTGWGSACFTGIGNGYWYFGWGAAGSFYLVSTRKANPGQTHSFPLYRSGGTYVGYVDSTEIGRVDWANWFDNVSAGLESYMGGAIVTAHNYDSLQYSYLAGAWQWWAGEDASRVDSQMCGRWVSATLWYGGQNVSC